MIYVDTNIVLDILENDPNWAHWSIDAIERSRMDSRLVSGFVVAAEVGHYVRSPAGLANSFARLFIDLIDADIGAAFAAGQAYREYRQRGGERPSLLPDFLIGAHAASLEASVLTRDPRRFRSYFPELILITPETTNHG